MNGAHRRKRRRRGSERSQDRRGGGVEFATLAPVEGCRAEWPCNWHGECSGCGETIHLAGFAASPGFGHYSTDQLAAMVVGVPARCIDCRGRP